ncbi:MAG: aminotransferase class I/II-fold pyridoxal phosphate-dependent enzyme [Lachnospiraceae bacterium]|nr:aminotransferase class I/II-fold pyridoxal phosphate-dependent enzyme [Lachnospiraceae bacterium]
MKYNFPREVHLQRPSMIREFSNKTKQWDDAINLTIGQPDFDTPQRIKQAGIKAIEEGHTGYTSNDGLQELREAACVYMKEKYGLTYDPNWEMIITDGATQALDSAFRALLSDGDEVIIPAPVYPGYTPLIRFLGAFPVLVDTRESNFILTPEQLDAAYTSYTKVVVLPYPNNPTGAMPSKEDLIALEEWFLAHPDVYIISDEIYSGLAYRKPHISIASLSQEMWERTLVINGLSKSHAMTGWRIGFLAGPRIIQDETYKVHQASVTCATSISQYAALEAVKSDAESIEMSKAYEERTRFVSDALKEMGFDVRVPDGAFYVFPSIARFGLNSVDFSNRLITDCHVGTVPGSAFSKYGEGYVRISVSASMDKLKEAMSRMRPWTKRIIAEQQARDQGLF